MTGRNLALCGVLTALAAVLLLAGSLFPAALFCAPLLAMAALLPVLEEAGCRAAAVSYAAAALLALLLAADRETALVYLFFGWYPLLRPQVNRLPGRLLRLVVKLALCGGAVFLLYGLTWKLLGLPAAPDSRLLNAAALLLGGLVFLLMDAALERMTLLWRQKLRRRLFR